MNNRSTDDQHHHIHKATFLIFLSFERPFTPSPSSDTLVASKNQSICSFINLIHILIYVNSTLR